MFVMYIIYIYVCKHIDDITITFKEMIVETIIMNESNRETSIKCNLCKI